MKKKKNTRFHDSDFDSHLTAKVFSMIHRLNRRINFLENSLLNKLHGLNPVCEYFNVNNRGKNS